MFQEQVPAGICCWITSFSSTVRDCAKLTARVSGLVVSQTSPVIILASSSGYQCIRNFEVMNNELIVLSLP
jgi:hypothetical protein